MLEAMEGLKEEEQEEAEEQYEKDMKLTHMANGKDLDEMSFIGTAMVFLVAGYDTTGMTLSWICYELAKNPDLQRRLQEELEQARRLQTKRMQAIEALKFEALDETGLTHFDQLNGRLI